MGRVLTELFDDGFSNLPTGTIFLIVGELSSIRQIARVLREREFGRQQPISTSRRQICAIIEIQESISQALSARILID
jgi:hypothetical protein